MKFTLSWLKDYLETNESLETITDTMTSIGLEIEGVEDKAALFSDYKVGHVVKADQHPDADRLKVCEVDVGEDKPLQIVCGAPNARAGIKIAFAPPGAYVPGIDVTLKKASIRGVESNGMMCSERELCLSDEHDGIIELPEETKVGEPLAPVLGLDDPVIDVAITPNRGDCAGVFGVARDLAAAGVGTLKIPEVKSIQGDFETPVSITIDNQKACPLFLGRLIKNVKNGPSPKWLQDRLRAIGLRPISALVDITNYFCIGLNRPLHVFDADQLTGNITVRDSQKGEELAALNDKSYNLEAGMTVVCDESGVLGLGGIIGGENTGCTESTMNVLLECAYFDPITTARTGRTLQIDSDARYRFERGVNPIFTHDGMALATQMVLDLCGGEPGTVIQAGEAPDITQHFDFDLNRTEKLGGVKIDETKQIAILNNLGFQTEQKKGSVYAVQTPSWRHDIEGATDFVEEILRIHGYDHIPPISVTKQTTVTQAALNPQQQFVTKARRLLAGRGLQETVTWSFIEKDKAVLFGLPETEQQNLTLLNPISTDMDTMRPSALPTLIEGAVRNQAKGFGNATLFETGPVFSSLELEKGQEIVISGLRAGEAQGKHWTGDNRPVDIMDVKADVLSLLGATGTNLNPQIVREAPSYYHPGRSAVMKLGKNTLAAFGELHPTVCRSYGAKETMVGFELFVEQLPLKGKKKSARPKLEVSAFQPVKRDFAFLVSVDVPADDCVRAIKMADKNLIEKVEIFDVYQGKGVDEGQKSLALSVTLQPRDKTLTDEELEAVSHKIIETVSSKTGAVLRS